MATNISDSSGLTKHYTANFDAKQYRQQMGVDRRREHLEFVISKQCSIFSDHELAEERRLLDVGSGPTLWHVMSGSAKYKNITLSDPLLQNRQILQQYIDNPAQDQSWTDLFMLVAKLEGDVTKWPEVQDRLRTSVKQVVWCDIHEESPLGKDKCDGLYDCVTSTLCVECACTDVSSYKQAVKNLVSLAKPGGSVILSATLGGSYYHVGGTMFPMLTITSETMSTALEEAGCTVNKIFTHKKAPAVISADTIADVTGLCIVEGLKQKDTN